MSALAEQLLLEQACRSYDNSRYNLEDIIQFMDAELNLPSELYSFELRRRKRGQCLVKAFSSQSGAVSPRSGRQQIYGIFYLGRNQSEI